jgi:hypothetical protein
VLVVTNKDRLVLDQRQLVDPNGSDLESASSLGCDSLSCFANLHVPKLGRYLEEVAVALVSLCAGVLCWLVDMWTSTRVGGWVLGHRGTVQEVVRRYDLFTSGRGRPHNRIRHG